MECLYVRMYVCMYICVCVWMYVRGVFKKRPNFLNSTPTRTESARCGYWAHLTSGFDNKLPFVLFQYEHYSSSYIRWTEHVRKLFVGLATKWQWKSLKINVWVCVWKLCCKLGKSFTETFHLRNQAYGEDCMSRTQCCEWFKRFKEGRMSVGEDRRPGQLPHQQTTTMLREFLLWFVEMVV